MLKFLQIVYMKLIITLLGFDVLETISDAKHNDGKLFKFKHGKTETYRTDRICKNINNSGYIKLNDSLIEAAELLINNFSPFDKPTTMADKYVFSKEAARYLYSGIVGDSGRFLYNSTTPHTFEIAGLLVSKGLLLSQEVYQPMYQKNIQDLRVTAYVLTHFEVSPHGVAYYVLSEEIQKELQITVERGKENINQFANIDGIEIWCSITQDTKRNRWKVSIRSKALAVNEVASHFKGGGHDQASGAEIPTLDELPKLIQELDDLIVSHSK